MKKENKEKTPKMIYRLPYSRNKNMLGLNAIVRKPIY